jgi:hypothetical protein
VTAYILHPSEFGDQFAAVAASLARMLGQCGTATSGADSTEQCCFELTGRQERPLEFLQSTLDLLRVLYEPFTPGTFQLNSNWDLVRDSVPAQPFRLGYASVLGEPDETIASMAQGCVARRLCALGYVLDGALATFVSVSAGLARFDKPLNLMREVQAAFGAGFTAAQVLAQIEDVSAGVGIVRAEGCVHAGLARDEALERRLRVSLWTFLPLAGPHASGSGT